MNKRFRKRAQMNNKAVNVTMSIIIFLAVLGTIGWIINLVSVIILIMSGAALSAISIFQVFQIVGIFVAPLGGLTGWLSLFV